jgi:polyvinyl alcohol dehydrogenase (cytochrome)
MKATGAGMSDAQRRQIALFLTGKEFGNAPVLAAKEALCSSVAGVFRPPAGNAGWNGWSPDLANTRFQPNPNLRPEGIPGLRLRWAFGVPGTTGSKGQPSIVNGHVFVGSESRAVYSLDARTGCIIWMFEASAGVRAAITVGKPTALTKTAAFFGDARAFVYALDAATGAQIWKVNVESFPAAHVTGSPKLHADRLYVPISIVEEGLAINPRYECCKSRPGIVALDAATGREIWRFRTIQEEPRPVAKNKIGTQLWGPAGASVWSSPTLDPEHNAIYIATGNNHSNPTTPTSDAVIALTLDTGRLLWSHQVTEKDAYNVACVSLDRTNCPDPGGPDFDFGSSPVLAKLANGKRILMAGQKSGVMTALDADSGKVVWQIGLGKGGLLGGIQWGSAAGKDAIYVPLSDIAWIGDKVLNPRLGGGLFALQIATGEKLWAAPPGSCEGRKNCSPAQSSAVSAIPGAVFSGSVDGHIRAYSTKDGKVIWDFDTVRQFETVNRVAARGGSMDGPGPAIAEGIVVVPSGYGNWGGLAGNALLAFSVDGK